ncbi:hypothetical protein ACFV8T_33540 [Streptomyces sp. NPDC059832]|uniref:hypothetical protein n=1 Tax=Streptomyces sp. NPDC059832 TaxID=3346966 RepID=UPI00364ABB1B
MSTGLVYYHFSGRAGLLRSTLDFISTRVDRYTEPAEGTARPRNRLEEMPSNPG